MRNPKAKEQYKMILHFMKEYTADLGEPANQKQQDEILKKIEEFPSPRQFFVIFDLRECEIIWSKNLKLLGYNDTKSPHNPFSFLDWLTVLPEEFSQQYIELATATYEIAKKKKDTIAPLREHYSLKMPIWSRLKKEYVIVEQTGFPFSVDENNNMISNINYYNVLTEEYTHPFKAYPSFPIRDDWELELFGIVRKNLFPFTATETKLLKFYAENKKTSIQNAAERLNWNTYQVMNTNKEILKKARNSIGDFSEAKEFALYLRRLRWI